MQPETVDVHTSAAIDVPALAEYLRWHFVDGQVPGLRLREDIAVSQFTGGQSHLTYLVRAGGAELVLRRPTADGGPESAARVAREFTWLTAVHPRFQLAPRPYLFCDDASVLGSVFYVMERRRGIVVRDREPMPLAGHVAMRRQLSDAAVDALADLHRVDTTSEMFASVGDPIGFVDRQVRDCTTRWQQARHGEDVVGLDAVRLWLTAHEPPDAVESTIVHGAFTLDNLMVNPLAPDEIVALLDWELAAVGDPLFDLGVLLSSWASTNGPVPAGTGTITGQPGYSSRDELVDRYGRVSGRDVSDVRFYEVLALFARAVHLHEKRRKLGTSATSDGEPAQLGTLADALTERMLRLIEG